MGQALRVKNMCRLSFAPTARIEVFVAYLSKVPGTNDIASCAECVSPTREALRSPEWIPPPA